MRATYILKYVNERVSYAYKCWESLLILQYQLIGDRENLSLQISVHAELSRPGAGSTFSIRATDTPTSRLFVRTSWSRLPPFASDVVVLTFLAVDSYWEWKTSEPGSVSLTCLLTSTLQGLLAKSCLCPGFATLVSNLITSSNIEAQVTNIIVWV